MAEPTSDAHRRSPEAGLCETCSHQQVVRNTRGSVFSLCTRSRVDPAYPRYPRVPVRACLGYQPPEPAA